MLKFNIVNKYIEAYIEKFEYVHLNEIYKWEAVKCFQDNWDTKNKDFYEMISASLNLTKNLLASGNYFPRRMILKNTNKSPVKIKSFFQELFNEDEDLIKRITSFKVKVKKINQANFPDKHDYQDYRAILVYLSLKYPERYYIYKYTLFKEVSKIFGYSYSPTKGDIRNIGQYQGLCSLLNNELRKNQKLLMLHKNRLTDKCYIDQNLNILTQDFIYAVVNYLSTEDQLTVQTQKIKGLVDQVRIKDAQTIHRKFDFTPRMINYTENEIENKIIGDLGELWVKEYETERLKKLGKRKLSECVEHVSKEKGDGTGFDIQSFDETGNKIFIEVKTTRNSLHQPFYITRNELERSKLETDNYYLYRVYHFDEGKNEAKLRIYRGELSKFCDNPTQFRVELKKPSHNCNSVLLNLISLHLSF
jgi:hypothetical protein